MLTDSRRFKTFGYITMSQALSFVGDLKFGHYMKIPPRTMFTSQVVATTVSCFIQIAVLNYALGSIDGVCTREQPEHFTCPGGRVFFSGKSPITTLFVPHLPTNILLPNQHPSSGALSAQLVCSLQAKSTQASFSSSSSAPSHP